MVFVIQTHITPSSGTYGNFEIMPLLCPGGFNTCTTTLDARERLRKPNTDGTLASYAPKPRSSAQYQMHIPATLHRP
jgi:hypothetical protein